MKNLSIAYLTLAGEMLQRVDEVENSDYLSLFAFFSCDVYNECIHYIETYTMIRTQIYLTKKEKANLAHLSDQTGKNQSELIREAIDVFCAANLQSNRLILMQSARGLWKKRQDLPDFTKLRKEFDRIEDDEE